MKSEREEELERIVRGYLSSHKDCVCPWCKDVKQILGRNPRKGHVWAGWEDEYLRKNYYSAFPKELIDHLGRNWKSIRSHALTLGLRIIIPLTHQGRTMTMQEWAKEFGMHRDTLCKRLVKLGWSMEEALATPAGMRKKITFQGKSLSILDWSKEVGIHEATLRKRLKQGWTVERAFTVPPVHPSKVKEGVTYQGRTMSVYAWAKELDMDEKALRRRFILGWSVEEVFTTPPAETGRRVSKAEKEGGLVDEKVAV